MFYLSSGVLRSLCNSRQISGGWVLGDRVYVTISTSRFIQLLVKPYNKNLLCTSSDFVPILISSIWFGNIQENWESDRALALLKITELNNRATRAEQRVLELEQLLRDHALMTTDDGCVDSDILTPLPQHECFEVSVFNLHSDFREESPCLVLGIRHIILRPFQLDAGGTWCSGSNTQDTAA